MFSNAIAKTRGSSTERAPRMSGWVWILLAGFFEVGFTYALKMAQTDQRYWTMFLICTIVSFELLAQGIKTVPLSIGYAVWTGIGSVGAFIVGVAVFDDSLSVVRVLLVSGLIAALVTLKLVATNKPEPGEPKPATATD